MKNKIRDYISEIEEDTDNEDFNDDEDPLSDVRDNRRGTLLSARNITIALIALTIVFFGGYFAAFALAHEKYLQTEAELSICRSSIDSTAGWQSKFRQFQFRARLISIIEYKCGSKRIVVAAF